MERCLACEAVVSRADIATHALPLSTLCTWPIRELQRYAIIARPTLRNVGLAPQSADDRAQPKAGHCMTMSPVHHGLASEATLHGADRFRPRKRGSAPRCRLLRCRLNRVSQRLQVRRR